MTKDPYTPTEFCLNTDFISLLKKLYASSDNLDFFLEEYERAYDFCLTSEHIKFYPLAFFQDKKLIAHVALIIDDRLPPHEAFFGFFEVIDDVTVFETVWLELASLAREHNIQVLKGPVNGSIWHQYRCVKEESSVPFFRTEPNTPSYYYDFLSQANPNSEITYSSGVRESYVDILGALKVHKDVIEQKLNEGDFKIEVTKETTKDTLIAISGLSAAVFDDKSWGYTKLDNSEFSKLYDVDKINDHIYKLFLLYHNNVLVGYCSTMKEGVSLICKTICIAPQFQGTGLGNALALKIHEEAERDGIEKIMYVLVRDGNQVHNYPTEDIEIFRRYAVFDYKITV
jgi:ribosomal protein S18 acetylase RimI-like enzyme